MAAVNSTVTYREIPGYPGYRVGDDGTVWSRCTPRKHRLSDAWTQLNPYRLRTGRIKVQLANDRIYFVHRLVLLAFVGPCPEGRECCHNDGDPGNNRLSNLRWDTRESNYRDRDRHGATARGERHGRAKLTADIVRAIRAEFAGGGVTVLQLAARHGTTEGPIRNAIKRRTWKHVA